MAQFCKFLRSRYELDRIEKGDTYMTKYNSLSGVKESVIKEAELKLHTKFPEKLREAYLNGNKYSIDEWEFYPFKDENYIKKTWDDIVRANEVNGEDLPEGFICVADDGTGDQLGYLESRGDALFIWDHETRELDKVADSFDDLIGQVKQSKMKLTKDVAKQTERFIQTVKETNIVYGLSAEEDHGWAYAPSNEEETDVLLFFSTKSLARACKQEEWEDYHLIELLLSLVIEGWLPNMEEEGLLCGLDWDSNLIGAEVEPSDVLEMLG